MQGFSLCWDHTNKCYFTERDRWTLIELSTHDFLLLAEAALHFPCFFPSLFAFCWLIVIVCTLFSVNSQLKCVYRVVFRSPYFVINHPVILHVARSLQCLCVTQASISVHTSIVWLASCDVNIWYRLSLVWLSAVCTVHMTSSATYDLWSLCLFIHVCFIYPYGGLFSLRLSGTCRPNVSPCALHF